VLESSPGLEVLEVGCPAQHDTLSDRTLPLPDGGGGGEREWDGQRFLRHTAATTGSWALWEGHEGWSIRDTGVAVATKGLASVVVLKGVAGSALSEGPHGGEFLFGLVVAGAVELETGGKRKRVGEGGSFAIPGDLAWGLSVGPASEAEIVLVRVPAKDHGYLNGAVRTESGL
jgi:hypothetical protein